jgi:hypothetical protein
VRIEAPANPEAAEGETVGEAVYDRVSGASSQAEEQVVDNAEEPREIARIVLPPSQDDASATVDGPVGGEAPTASTTEPPGQSTADANAPTASEPAADEIGPRLVPTYVVRADGTIVETTAAGSAAADPTAAQNEQLATETEPIEPVPVPTVAIEDAGAAADATTGESPTLSAPAAVETPPEAEVATNSEEISPRPSIDDQPTAVASAEPTDAATGGEEGNPEDSIASAEPAAAPPTSASGYLVQLSAQRSMDEAQSAYAAAQRQYASVLNSLTPQIQEADLGAKGIFYRVRVGPWENRDDAIKVCEALKAEGGNCFVTQ